MFVVVKDLFTNLTLKICLFGGQHFVLHIYSLWETHEDQALKIPLWCLQHNFSRKQRCEGVIVRKSGLNVLVNSFVQLVYFIGKGAVISVPYHGCQLDQFKDSLPQLNNVLANQTHISQKSLALKPILVHQSFSTWH